MNLLQYLLKQTQLWAFVFPQERSLQRAIALAFGILCGVGKRTLTRAISFQGNTQKDWSADYKVFSRSAWEARALFHPILQQAIQEQKLERIVLSVDDTRVWRNGKHVPQAQWHRDPLGPPFQTNLRWGHRFLQASLVLPLHAQDRTSSSRPSDTLTGCSLPYALLNSALRSRSADASVPALEKLVVVMTLRLW